MSSKSLVDSFNRNFDRRERIDHVLKLRSYGFTIRFIAQSLRMKRATVGDIVKNYSKDMRDRSAVERRSEEFELVAIAANQVNESMFPVLLGSTGASDKVRVSAAHAILKALEAKRRLFGLDAPAQVEVSDTTPSSDDGVRELLLARMFALEPSHGEAGALCTILRAASANRRLEAGHELPDDAATVAHGVALLERAVVSLDS